MKTPATTRRKMAPLGVHVFTFSPLLTFIFRIHRMVVDNIRIGLGLLGSYSI